MHYFFLKFHSQKLFEYVVVYRIILPHSLYLLMILFIQTLVAFEYLWYQAWVQSIDQAKAGLQATLIIRHPDDGKLYVNFDQEILQLIRESKCLGKISVNMLI